MLDRLIVRALSHLSVHPRVNTTRRLLLIPWTRRRLLIRALLLTRTPGRISLHALGPASLLRLEIALLWRSLLLLVLWLRRWPSLLLLLLIRRISSCIVVRKCIVCHVPARVNGNARTWTRCALDLARVGWGRLHP